MKKRLICIAGMLFVCTGCQRGDVSQMTSVEQVIKQEETEKQTIAVKEPETKGENSAFYSTNQDKFIESGPIEYQDYFCPEFRFTINVSQGRVSQKMSPEEIYFSQSEYFADRYASMTDWMETLGWSEEQVYCLYFDVELTNRSGMDITYSIANWKIERLENTEYGNLCMHSAISPAYDMKPAEQDDLVYYEMDMKDGETKKFRVAFVLDDSEYYTTTGRHYTLETSGSFYLSMTGDCRCIYGGAGIDYSGGAD